MEFAYFPFLGGPRRGIGVRFAMIEAQLISATTRSIWLRDHAVPTTDLELRVVDHEKK